MRAGTSNCTNYPTNPLKCPSLPSACTAQKVNNKVMSASSRFLATNNVLYSRDVGNKKFIGPSKAHALWVH